MRRRALPSVLAVLPVLAAGWLWASAGHAQITLTGRVELPDGGPAQGLELVLVPQTTRYQYGLLVLEQRHLPDVVARAVTGADGGYSMQAPEPGMWRLLLTPEGYRGMEILFLPLLDDQIVPTVELIAETRVRVQVLDAQGTPAAGARVMASPPPQGARRMGARNDWRPTWRQAFADESGVAVLQRGNDESLQIYARAEGHADTEVAGVDGPSATVAFAPATILPLEVMDARGEPVAGALIRMGARWWPIGITAEDGSIGLPMPEEGQELVRVFTADDRRAERLLERADWTPDEPQTLTLPDRDRRVGRVLDRGTKTPLAGAFAWRGGDPAGFVRTDSTGSYSLPIRGESDYWVWGAAPGYLKEAVQSGAGAAGGPTVSLQRAVRVYGVVEDETGQAIDGAVLTTELDMARAGRRLSYGARQQLETAVSDLGGRFAIGSLHPDVGYRLQVKKPGFAPSEVRLPNPRSDAASELRVVLESGRRAIGRVIGPEGEPIGGARVGLARAPTGGGPRQMIMARMQGNLEQFEAYSDARGEFALVDLAAGNYSLAVSASGYAETRLPAVEVLPEPVTDLGELSLESGATIEGRVTDSDGAPLEGAEVRVSQDRPMGSFVVMRDPSGLEPAAYSDASGLFSVADQRAGERIDLEVRQSGFATARVPGIVAPTSRPVEVRMEHSSSVRGRVVDTTGRAVSGAELWVMIEFSTGRISTSQSGGQAKSDESGRFEIEGVDAGELQLSARAEGYRVTELRSLSVEPGQDLEGVEVVLEPGASISGRVVDPTGRPVAGAQLMVRENTTTGFSHSFQSFGHTDGDGRYRIEGVELGPRSVTAQHDDFQPVSRDIEVRLGDNPLDLAFEGGAEISGRVVDESGAAVAGATVTLDSQAVQFWGSRETTTDNSGAFTIEGLSEATYGLQVEAGGFALEFVEGLEVGPSGLSGIEVRLSKGTAIVGQLYGLEQSDRSTVEIFAVKAPRGWAVATIMPDGGYRIEDLAPGTYSVNARTADNGLSVSEEVEVVAGVRETVLDLQFEAGLTLTGRIFNGGEPMPGASLSLSGLDVSSGSSGISDHEGRFEIRGIQPGRHLLSLNSPQGGISHQEQLEITSDRDIVVRVATARVSGHVLDVTDSRPLRAVTVRLEPLEEASAASFGSGSSAMTDSAGFFRFSGASVGSYRLIAELDGFAPGELAVTVSEGLDQDNLELRMTPTEGVRVYVTLPSGLPATQFFAGVVDASGRSLTTGIHTAGEDGGARLSIGAGAWELHVSAVDTAVWSGEVKVPGPPISIALGPQARLTVHVPELLDTSTLADVRITGSDGRPFRSVQWMWSRDSWPMHRGKAAIQGLAPGSWSVQVTAPDGRVWQGQVTLAAGENPELILR